MGGTGLVELKVAKGVLETLWGLIKRAIGALVQLKDHNELVRFMKREIREITEETNRFLPDMTKVVQEAARQLNDSLGKIQRSLAHYEYCQTYTFAKVKRVIGNLISPGNGIY